MFNNLKFFREMGMINRLQIAKLLNINVYTYNGYENNRIVIPKSLEIMISKIYNIDVSDIYCNPEMLSDFVINEFNQISKLSDDEKNEKLIFNLSGKKLKRLTYREIANIKNNLKQ